MLMMLAGLGVLARQRHCTADAHDARWVGGLGVEIAQLMLMMRAGSGVLA